MSSKCLKIEVQEIVVQDNGEVIYRLEGRIQNSDLEQYKNLVEWTINGETVATYDPWYVGGQISYAESNDPPGNVKVGTLQELRSKFGAGDVEYCANISPYNPELDICNE